MNSLVKSLVVIREKTSPALLDSYSFLITNFIIKIWQLKVFFTLQQRCSTRSEGHFELKMKSRCVNDYLNQLMILLNKLPNVKVSDTTGRCHIYQAGIKKISPTPVCIIKIPKSAKATLLRVRPILLYR